MSRNQYGNTTESVQKHLGNSTGMSRKQDDNMFWKETLLGNICQICLKPTENNLMRHAYLLRHGTLQATYGPYKINRRICRKCLTSLPILFSQEDRLIENPNVEIKAAFEFKQPVDLLIRSLKFHRKKEFAALIADLMLLVLKNEFNAAHDSRSVPEILIPVPLAATRFKERGYNQAELITKELSKRLGIPYRSDLLIRTRDTKRQTETKTRDERMQNVRDAFHLAKTPVSADSTIADLAAHHKSVLIIDDVTTSGMTLKEAALPLMREGIQVKCLVAAKEKTSH